MTLVRGALQCLGKFVEPHFVQVLLRRVGSRVAHQAPESTDVAITLPSEAVSEAVPKLVRGQATDTCALADPPHHPHQRLIARRNLWIFSMPAAFMLRDPLFDLDREHVIVAVRSKAHPDRAELRRYVGIKRDLLPVPPFP